MTLLWRGAAVLPPAAESSSIKRYFMMVPRYRPSVCPYMMLSSTAGCSTLARLCVFGSISAGPSGPHCHLEQRFISAAPPCLHPHTFTSVRHAAAVILMFITSDRKTRH